MAAKDEGQIPEGEQPGGEFVVLTEDDGDDKGKKGAPAEKAVEKAAEKPDPKALEKKGADDDDDDDEDDGDTRLAAGSDEDDEKKREQRRAEKRRRKERARQARIAKDRHIEELTEHVRSLTQQVGGIGERVVRADLTQLAGRRDAAAQRVRRANDLIARALEVGDGKAFTEAQQVRDEAVYEYRQIDAVLKRADSGGSRRGNGGGEDRNQRRQPAPQQREAAPDPFVSKLVDSFTKKVSWLNPEGDDDDSVMAVAIDNQVAAEGYDPRTSMYWDTLEQRLREKLPHRFEKQSTGPRGPALGGRGSSGDGKQFYLSPARMQAIKDANKWDDPVMRQKAIKAYAKYDRDNQNNAR